VPLQQPNRKEKAQRVKDNEKINANIKIERKL
jgi:hypothetical protein